MTELGNRDLSGRGIEAAIEVHRARGPGFLESVYESALGLEPARRGIRFERQQTIKIFHQGVEVGEHRLDLLVEARLMVELKAVRQLDDIFFAIGRSSVKAGKIEDGLLLNFATMPLTIKRIGRERNPVS